MVSPHPPPPGREPVVAALARHAVTLGVVACLLALAAANISLRANWHEVEDGVLWAGRPDGVVAAEVAPGTAGAAAGVRAGDLLLAVNGQPVEHPDQVLEFLHGARAGERLAYTILRDRAQQLRQLTLQPVPQGNRALYFVLAAVAIFTLLVGCLVRLRRPSDPATLHFFWLSVAFFGVLAFSFSGRLDRLDWMFYWADVIAVLVLPPLFVHFALVFPDRPHAFLVSSAGRLVLPLLYAPAGLLGIARVMAVLRSRAEATWLTTVMHALDRLELLYLGAGLVGGLGVMLYALRRVRSVTARRQLRWIVWGTTLGALPFVVAYVVPFVLGRDPWPRIELLALPLGLVPLAFASAVVRYRLMDVEVIIKRGVVYATAVSAIAAIYAVLLKLATEVFLGGSAQHNSVIAVLATLVVVLLAPIVKNAVQTTLDRAYYRDRYDYRRALVGFARDLNSDLDLDRLSDRLVERVRETLALERMALLIAPGNGAPEWVPLHMSGFEAPATLRLAHQSGIGGRMLAGHAVLLEDPATARRFTADEVSHWRELGVHSFLPCVSKETASAVMALGAKESGEPLTSEDLSLLAAVAGQVATALENGRLYQQLRSKADELDRLREFSENIIASLNDGLAVVGLNDRILRWNPALEALYGISRAEAVGQSIERLFDPAFLESLHAARQEQGGSGTLYRVPLRSRHQEPRTLLLNVALVPLRTPDGAVAGAIMIFEDTTARVKLEEQLQISDKMASIGLLAAGVAHEVNTPLTGISSYAQMLLDGAAEDDPRTTVLKKIERQTFRAAKIVNGLLNLARPASVDAGPVDLHDVINDVLSLLEHQLKSGSIQVRKDLSAGAALVRGAEHKLQQVFLNLFLNARDAMPKGGWLSVSSAIVGPSVVIEVGDTGSGIPSEFLARIYDPFFTTKPIGQGTGLGLSITYGIVQEHNGTITCDSTPGQGTRFVLSFPAATGASTLAEPAAR
jgi:PAS domain S-box-containing protein